MVQAVEARARATLDPDARASISGDAIRVDVATTPTQDELALFTAAVGDTRSFAMREVLRTLQPGTRAFDRFDLTCRAGRDCVGSDLRTQEIVLPSDTDDPSGPRYFLGPQLIDGSRIEHAEIARAIPDGSSWAVELAFSLRGTVEFEEVTTQLMGRQLAVVVGNEVMAAPAVNEPIIGGRAAITGDFTKTEARSLAVVLSSDPLPFPLEVVAQPPPPSEDTVSGG
ncbi:MAG: hypothetical protein WD556_10555 [Actinomycetota bacterium]